MTEDKKTVHDIIFGKKKVSVNFKLALVIIMAGVIAVGAFLLLGLIEGQIVRSIGASESVKRDAVDERFADLNEYIVENNVEGDDTKKLQAWVRRQSYTEIIVSDRTGELYSGGWVASTVRSSFASGENNSDSTTLKKDVPVEGEDLYNRTVRFLDKDYYVYIDVYLEYRYKAILDNVKLLLAALIFLIIVLVYNRRVLRRIVDLSDQVNRVRAGELDLEIDAGDPDEIGNLATDIDLMRNSVVQRMNSEKAAQDANNQLITSMSHDIRTPLTSLIGYLDIIAGHKYKTEEELQRYISSCSDKAVQLKGLSDKLFQYFLVYNNEAQERELEELDAGILFQQFMIEHISELTQYGYEVELTDEIPENVMLNTETSAMQRLFDNLFSNIMKYASHDYPIIITAEVVQNKIKIVLKNHVTEDAGKVESTKIGVKTCKKIVDDLGGTFRALEENGIYKTIILFDIKEIKEPEEDETVKEKETPKTSSADSEESDDETLRDPGENSESIIDAISQVK